MKRILYPAKLSFRIEGEIEFSDKQKLKEFITTKLTLQEIIKTSLSSMERALIYQQENLQKYVSLVKIYKYIAKVVDY